MQNQPKVEEVNNETQNASPMKRKIIYGVDFSEFELYSIRMICDFLFLDRFNDCASFVRFEQCFGPLFSSKNKEFKLVEAYKEIVGPKRKYITFRRMIKAYINWKSNKSNNYSFNFFMNEVFRKMIKKRGEVVGELIEGQRVFSTKNCRNRKIITKFSVLTDEAKNKIKGFVIEYDEVFKAILCKQEKKEDINLEIHFDLFHSQGDKLSRQFHLDRDGISHIAGKYNNTTKLIKFLIFKCRSGKTLYIGDSKEEPTDDITPFIFGSSKCQLKTMHIELINDTLAYIQPKYQISTRKNDNLEVDFDYFDENFLNNDPPKYEEAELEKVSKEPDDKTFLQPLVPDDQFVDKMSLVESKPGKNFKDIYRSFFEKDERKPLDKLRESVRKILDYGLNEKKREQKMKNEQEKLVLKDSYYRKNNYESLFVKIIKMKMKSEEDKKKEKEKGIENDDDYIEEEEEEENDLPLIKIKSGVYEVKETKETKEKKDKAAPLRAMAQKMKEEIVQMKKNREEEIADKSKKGENVEKKEKEPQDNVSKSKANQNTDFKDNLNKNAKEEKVEKGPQDSVKK